MDIGKLCMNLVKMIFVYVTLSYIFPILHEPILMQT